MHPTSLVTDDSVHRRYRFAHSIDHAFEIEKYEADSDPHAVFGAANTTPKGAGA